MPARIISHDNGYRALMARVHKASKTRRGVEVGVIGDGGSYEDGVTVVQVATWAEFGIGQPQRSWLRGFIDEHKSELERRLKEAARFALTTDPQVALERFGLSVAADIKVRITEGIPPENADSTIDRKGSSTPLIDTAQFLNSIRHRIK